MSNKKTILKEKQSSYNKLVKRQDEVNSLIESLKDNEAVKQYLLLKKERKEILPREKELKKEIDDLKISLCEQEYGSHFFVSNKKMKDNKYPNCTMVTCIHCGLRRNIEDYIIRTYDSEYTAWVLEERLDIALRGVYKDSEIKSVKNIYDETKTNYPNASDDEISEHIKIVKKMKGGKLC